MPAPTDFEKFMTDPAFQGDRDFFTRLVNRIVDDRVKTELEKKKAQEHDNIFDALFGGKPKE